MVVVRVNMHLATTSDFRFDVTLSRWRPCRYFTQKSAATWCVNAKRLTGAAYATVPASY